MFQYLCWIVIFLQVLFCRLTDEQKEVYQEYLDSKECQSILNGRFMVSQSSALRSLLRLLGQPIDARGFLYVYNSDRLIPIFSSPGRSPGRAIVLPPMSALALAAAVLAKC